MSRKAIDELLDRYLKGKASTFEQALVENWLLTPDEEPSAWEKMDTAHQALWLGTVFERIQVSIDEQPIVKLPIAHTNWKRIIAVAATITAFFCLFNFWPSIKPSFLTDQMVELKMPTNTKQQLTLSDGSRVWLNSGAELKYAEKFTGDTREVYLNGEAYFDIKHDPQHPFIVHTGKLSTTVLGTAFNIKATAGTNQIKVTVTRGKVKVSRGEKTLGLLLPDQEISYNTNNQTYQQYQIDAAKVTNWLPSDLFFDNATFGEATQILEQRFNVKIQFEHEQVKNCRFSGTAIATKEIEEIIDVMCKFNNCTYKRKGNTITIFGNGCN